MEGRLHVKKTTNNTIFVEWSSLYNIQQDSRKLISPPFTLTIDDCAIPFALSIECQENFIIRAHQNSSRVGRGIAFVAVKDNNLGKKDAMRTYFMERWEETCDFANLGTLPKCYSCTLTINCKIVWLGFVNDIATSNPPLSPSAVAITFSDNKIYPDFTIIAEGQEIPSHKGILARHSSVFSTMFETPMKELEENKVIIEDIECSTMEILLKIIYTGNAEDLSDVDVILKVLHAAEKYQIYIVKSLCERKLQLLIDENNVLKLLEIGDKYHALELCETCITYITAIRNEEISMEFERLSETIPNISSVTAKVLMGLSFLVPNEHTDSTKVTASSAKSSIVGARVIFVRR